MLLFLLHKYIIIKWFLMCETLVKILYHDKLKKKFDQEATLRNLSARTRKSYW